MEETIISFNTAKLAKEKGFNLESLYFYVKPNSKIFGVDEKNRTYPIKNTSKKLYKCGEEAVLNIKNVFSAPTQSLLQKWLREEHHVDIIIASLLLGYKYIIYQRYPPKTIDNFVNNIFETYEEALEVGLYESLKLITT